MGVIVSVLVVKQETMMEFVAMPVDSGTSLSPGLPVWLWIL